jgi:hypothetical protein
VNKIEIKIVGSIPDEDTLDEIQSIAKIFVYEQRIKHFNYPAKNNNPVIKKPTKFYKKIDNHHIISTHHLPHKVVRGLI